MQTDPTGPSYTECGRVAGVVYKNFPFNHTGLRELAATIKAWVLANRQVQAFRWWLSQRKVAKYQRLLSPPVTRRGFLSGTTALLLAPFVPVPAPLPPHLVRELIVSEYLKTPQGRMKLAQSMIQPLRTRIDYAAIGRRVFQVEQLPPAPVAYLKDSNG